MSFRIVLRPEVRFDLAEAADWYEQQKAGLGADFTEAIFKAIDSLADNPLLRSRRHRKRNIRFTAPERFPYRIVYEVLDGVVLIVCVIHFARDESSWRERIDG